MNIMRLSDNPVLRSIARRCWPKEIHPSRGKAQAAIRSLRARGLDKNATLHEYHCSHCRGWHTGHDRPEED